MSLGSVIHMNSGSLEMQWLCHNLLGVGRLEMLIGQQTVTSHVLLNVTFNYLNFCAVVGVEWFSLKFYKCSLDGPPQRLLLECGLCTRGCSFDSSPAPMASSAAFLAGVRA